jgi:hypothetical protein
VSSGVEYFARGALPDTLGDRIGIVFSPSNYTPTIADDAIKATHLAAHLNGLDLALTGKTGNAYSTITGDSGASGTVNAGVSDTLNLESGNLIQYTLTEPGTDNVKCDFILSLANQMVGSGTGGPTAVAFTIGADEIPGRSGSAAISALTADQIRTITNKAASTNLLVASGLELLVDTINEKGSGTGVTIEGVEFKDDEAFDLTPLMPFSRS